MLKSQQVPMLKSKNILLVAFLILLALPFFLFLGRDSIQVWDEARNTLNLYEMYKSGNLLVTTYQGEPDMWNTKPPFLHWIQLIFANIFGFNEFALRLPSAISGFLTCLVLGVFLKKYTKNIFLAFLASFVLATSSGFIDIHSSRTGDYDAMLVLFTTITTLCLFSYSETKKNKFLYLFFISLSLSVLTKSIASLLLFPAYGIFLLYNKQVLLLLKNKHFYFGILIFIFSVGSFYLLREYYNPGYLKAVYENELVGRYTKGLEGNYRPFNFYFENFSSRLQWWLFFVFTGFFLGLFNKNIKIVRISGFSLTIVITHLFIISSAQTKLPWYELPVYPFLAIATAIALYTIYYFLNYIYVYRVSLFNNYRNSFSLLFIIALCIFPYYKIIAKVSSDKQEEYFRNNQLIPRYLKEVLYDNRTIENGINICVSMQNHHYHTEYYMLRLREKGYEIQFCDWKNIADGQIILMGHDDALKQIIEDHYDFEILEHNQSDWNYWGIKKYLIKQKIKDFQD